MDATQPGVRGQARWRDGAALLLWALQPLAIAAAAPSVPPLLQAAMVSAAALFLFWMRTRMRQIPVFAHDSALRPGLPLALLAGLRIGLLVLGLSAAPLRVLLLSSAVLLLSRAAVDRRAPAWRGASTAALALAGLALAAAPLDRNAGIALLAGALWAAELWLRARPTLRACSAEKIAYDQLIGAVVVLPVASVALGETWLRAPSPAAWVALALQLLGGGLLLPPLWLAGRTAWGARAPMLLTLLLTAALAFELLQPSPRLGLAALALLLGWARLRPDADVG